MTDGRTIKELRFDMLNYLFGLYEHRPRRGVLSQAAFARAVEATPRRIEEAMTDYEIQVDCNRMHRGFRVLMRWRDGKKLYHVSDTHSYEDLLCIKERWAQRISKGRRLSWEMGVRNADPRVQRAQRMFDTLLTQEEEIVGMLNDALYEVAQ